MSTAKRWNRKGAWAAVAAIAAILTVGILLGPGVWSATSASNTLSPNNAEKDASCVVGAAHRNPAYDPVNHYVYVPNPDSSNISVLKAPCTVVATISTGPGSEPGAAAFDPSSNYVWVTDYALNQVYVISGTKIINTVVRTAENGLDGPRAITFDPVISSNGNGCMVVANYLNDSLTILCDFFPINDFYAAGNYPVYGSGPIALGYDPTLDYLLVANYLSSNVSTFALTNGGPIYEGGIATGSEPDSIAFDPHEGCDYIANFGSNNVTQFCVESGVYLVATIHGFDEPTSVTWSQAKLAVYVTNWGSGALWAIGGASGRAIVQKISSVPGIEGSTYDTATNNLYVTNDETNTVYVYST